MRDPDWESIEAELKREIPFEASSIAGVMQRVREESAPPRHVRAWHWFIRPRTVRVSPIAGVAVAAALAAMLVSLSLNPGGSPTEVSSGLFAADPVGEPSDVHLVQFVLVADHAHQVAMAGDFNDWNPQATPLRRTGPAGVWSVVVPLRPGAYQYAFLVDGTWVADATAPRASENAFGEANSIVLVGEGS